MPGNETDVKSTDDLTKGDNLEVVDPNDSVPGEADQPAPGDPDAIPAPEEGADTQEPGQEEPQETDPRLQEALDKIAELEKRLEPKGEEQEKQEPAPKGPTRLKDMPPEQRQETLKGWGITQSKRKNPDTGEEESYTNMDPEAFVEAVVGRLGMVLDMAKSYADQTIHGNTSEIRFDTVLSSMEKKAGFQDIRQYSEAVRQYLKDRYQPKDHSNPKFIEDGYFWAKGKNLKNAVKKAIQSTDRNKRIVKPASGGAPAPKPSGKLTPETMTNEQRRLAESTFRGMPREQAWKKYCELY